MADSWDSPDLLTTDEPVPQKPTAPPAAASWDSPDLLTEPAAAPVHHDPFVTLGREAMGINSGSITDLPRNFSVNFARHRAQRASSIQPTIDQFAPEGTTQHAIVNTLLDAFDAVKSIADHFDPKLEKTRAAAQKVIDLTAAGNYAAAGVALHTLKTMKGEAPIYRYVSDPTSNYVMGVIDKGIYNPLKVALTGKGERPWGSDVMHEAGIKNPWLATPLGLLFDLAAPSLVKIKGPGALNRVGRAAQRYTSVAQDVERFGGEMPVWSELAKKGDKEAKTIANLLHTNPERLKAGLTMSEKISRGQVHFPVGIELAGGVAKARFATPTFRLTEDGVKALMDQAPDLVPKDYQLDPTIGRILTKSEARAILNNGDKMLEHLTMEPGKVRAIPLPHFTGGGAETPPLPQPVRDKMAGAARATSSFLREYNPGQSGPIGMLRRATATTSYNIAEAFHKYPRPLRDTGKLEDPAVWENIKQFNRLQDSFMAGRAGEILKAAKDIMTVSPAELARAKAAEAGLPYIESLFDKAIKDGLPVEWQRRIIRALENPLLVAAESTDPVHAYMLRHWNTLDVYEIKSGLSQTMQRINEAENAAAVAANNGDKEGARRLLDQADVMRGELRREVKPVRESYNRHVTGITAAQDAGATALRDGNQTLAKKYFDRADYLRNSFDQHTDLYRAVLDDGGGGGGGATGTPPPKPSGLTPGRLVPKSAAEEGAAAAQAIQQTQMQLDALSQESGVIVDAATSTPGSPQQMAEAQAQLAANNQKAAQLQQQLEAQIQEATRLQEKAANEAEIQKMQDQAEKALQQNSDDELRATIAEMEKHPAMARPATALKSVREERAALSADQREALANQTVGDYLKQRYGETPDDYAARLIVTAEKHDQQMSRRAAKAKAQKELKPILEKPQGPPERPAPPKGGPSLTDVRRLTEEQSDIVPPKGYKPGKPLPDVPGFTFAYGSNPSEVFGLQHDVVPLEDVVKSHDRAGNLNPAHPENLQPRDRSRLVSRLQIQKIGGPGMKPGALLDDFKSLDRGAPIVTQDLRGVAGHGRLAAMEEAASQQHAAWKAYQEQLPQAAEAAGVPDAAAKAEAIRAQGKTPILVRKGLNPAEYERIAQDSNVSAAAGMGDFETALQDAKGITATNLAEFTVGEAPSIEKAISSTANRPFVQKFLASLPENEVGRVVDAHGNISPGGIRRIRAALLARAFPGETGKAMVEAFIETQDLGVKNVEKGLVTALPDLGKVEGMIEAGARPKELAISGDISKAVSVLARLRAEGTPVEEYLQQGSLWERETSAFQDKILQFMDRTSRSPGSLTDAVSGYAKAVEALPNEGQAGLFGEVKQVNKEELWDVAAKKAEGTLEGRKLAAAQRKAKPPELDLTGTAPAAEAKAPADAEGGTRLAEGAGEVARHPMLNAKQNELLREFMDGNKHKDFQDIKSSIAGMHGPNGSVEITKGRLKIDDKAGNVATLPIDEALLKHLGRGVEGAPLNAGQLFDQQGLSHMFDWGESRAKTLADGDAQAREWEAMLAAKKFKSPGERQTVVRELEGYKEDRAKFVAFLDAHPEIEKELFPADTHLVKPAWFVDEKQILDAPPGTTWHNVGIMPPDKQKLIEEGHRVQRGWVTNTGRFVTNEEAADEGLKMLRPGTKQGGAGTVSFMGTGHMIDMARDIPRQLTGIFMRDKEVAAEFAGRATDELLTFTPDMWNRYKAVRDMFDSLIYTEEGRGVLIKFIKEYFPHKYEEMADKTRRSTLSWLMAGTPEGPVRTPSFSKGRGLEDTIAEINRAHEAITGKKLISESLMGGLLNRAAESAYFQASFDWLHGVLNSMAMSGEELQDAMKAAGVKKIPGPAAAADIINSSYLMEKQGAAPELVSEVRALEQKLTKYGVHRRGTLEMPNSELGVGKRLVDIKESGALPIKQTDHVLQDGVDEFGNKKFKVVRRESLDLSREVRNELMRRTGENIGDRVTRKQLEAWMDKVKTSDGKALLQSAAEKLRADIQEAYTAHQELAPRYQVFITKGEMSKIGKLWDEAQKTGKEPFPGFLDAWSVIRDRGMADMANPKVTMIKMDPGSVPNFENLKMVGLHYYLVPETLGEHINHHIYNVAGGGGNNWLAKTLKPINDATQFWKGAATVYIPQYHFRNMMQNLYQSHAIAGMDRMESYGHAFNDLTGKAGSFTDGNGITRTFKSLSKMREQYGVSGTGFYGSDLETLLGSKKVDPFVAGRKAGQFIEDYSRTALWYDGMARGLSPWAAAMRLKKFLFDYSELSQFERRYLRPWFPFYTWMRKNLPLQMEQLIQNPAKAGIPVVLQHTLGEAIHGRQPSNEEMQTLYDSSQTGYPLVYKNRVGEDRITGLAGQMNTTTDLLQTFAADENPAMSALKMAGNMLNPLISVPAGALVGHDISSGKEVFRKGSRNKATAMFLPGSGEKPVAVPSDWAWVLSRMVRVLAIYNRTVAEFRPGDNILKKFQIAVQSAVLGTSYKVDFDKAWEQQFKHAKAEAAMKPSDIVKRENTRRANLPLPLPPMSDGEINRVIKDYEEAQRKYVETSDRQP